MSLVSAAAFVAVPALSFTWRMKLAGALQTSGAGIGQRLAPWKETQR